MKGVVWLDTIVKQFLEDIKVEYCWLLCSLEYEEKRLAFEDEDKPLMMRASFPYCCGLASQIAASFLAAHTDVECEVWATNPGMNIPHSWIRFDGGIIDFTFFQFESDIDRETKNRMKEFDISEGEFKKNISGISIFPERNKHHDRVKFILQHKNELLAVEQAKKYKFTPEDFYDYVREVFQDVQSNIGYQ